MAPRKTTSAPATKKTPAKKTAPPKETLKPTVFSPDPAPEPRSTAKHFAIGPNCNCGWSPNFDHAIGIDAQKQQHFLKNPPVEE